MRTLSLICEAHIITEGGTRTHTILRSLDFESSASADSATPACLTGTYKISDNPCFSRVSLEERLFSSTAGSLGKNQL